MGLRTFIAIEVPGNIQSSITSAIAPLRDLLADSVKWVREGNIHLTLKFLGETPEEKIREIEAAVSRAAGCFAPIKAEVKGTGVFPDTRRPSVLWVGLLAPPTLTELSSRIEQELAPLGFESDERPFSPHLTVGRLRRGARVPGKRLAAELERLEAVTLGSMDIREIILMKSDLMPGGPVYTRLFSARL